jgi:integrase
VKYLEPYSGATYYTYLTSLRTFFKWAVQSEILGSSPADKVVKIKSRNLQDDDLEPAILSVDQCRRLLKSAIQVDPGMVAYIAACLFGGLRPEREAAGLSWRDVGDQVLVMAKNAKSRQRRWVSNPLLMEWLAFGAIACAGALPVVGCRSRMERVRKDAGLLTGWGHDCMRHTFASMFMATHGAEKTIAQLGHGNYDMLFRHYRALVPEAIAKEFWSMRPSTLIPKSAKA